MTGNSSRRKSLQAVLFTAALLVGGVCRFYNLNWDDGYSYHPDEMNITLAVLRVAIPGQMDPGFFAYNGFPLYLYRAIAQILALVTNDLSWTGEMSKIALIGRFISALLSTLSIYLVYYIGKKTISESAALLAACLTATAVGLIQTAHYGVTESMLLFFLLAIAVCSIKAVQGTAGFSRCWYAMALFCGLAIGTKTSALSFLVLPAIAWAILFPRERNRAAFSRAASFCAITLLVFIIVSPCSLLNFAAFTSSMKYEGEVVRGVLRVPYTLQFQHTLPYWFFYKNLHWHTGLIIPTMGMLGMFFWLLAIGRRKEAVDALPLLFFGVLYCGYVGSWYAKFIRYMVLMIPILILGTCWLFDRMLRYRGMKPLAILIVLFTLVTNTVWAGAFISVYHNPSTRTAASLWIYRHIPENSMILIEHWDYPLPVNLRNGTPHHFNYGVLKHFDPDTGEKIIELSNMLNRGDYLILASRRLSGTITRSREKYPVTSSYYHKLFDGKLGYTPLKTFSSYPTVCGIEINDDSAEETFQVFDHPVVHIFKNSKRLPASHIAKKLRAQ